MITINESENKVIIEFGKNSIGSVVLTNINNILLIQEPIKTNLHIGEEIKIEDVKPLPNVQMEFSEIESIDVLIKTLEQIKQHLKYPYRTLLSAC